MADGDNNQEKIAQMQAQLDELKSKLEAAEVARQKAEGIAENAEAKFNDMAEETGASRKAVAEAARDSIERRKLAEQAIKDRDEFRNKVAEMERRLSELDVSGQFGGGGNNRKTLNEEVDELVAALTDEEQKLVDAAIEAADDKVRAAIEKGDGYNAVYRDILKEAKAQVSPVQSGLPHKRKKPAQVTTPNNGGVSQDEIKKLFKKEQERARNLPNAPGTGAGREREVQRTQVRGRQVNVLR